MKAQSWPEVHRHLLEEFKTKVSTASVHQKLLNRRKDVNETNQQYIIAMRKIAATGDVEEADVVNYVIGEITANDKGGRSFFANACTYKTLREQLAQFESLNSVQKSNGGGEIESTNT